MKTYRFIDLEISESGDDIAISNDTMCAQFHLWEEQNLSRKECIEQMATAVHICGFNEKAIERHLALNHVDAEVETYKF